MKYAFGLLILVWTAVLQVMGQKTDIVSMASTLGALCFFIIKEKYIGRLYAAVIYFVASAALSFYWRPFIFLSCIPLFDFAYLKKFWPAGSCFAAALYLSMEGGEYYYILVMLLSAFTGLILGNSDRNAEAGIQALDEERSLRYNLERAQNELIKSRSEIELLTEARERNRIARELHDSIGHGIAAVLIQLEAAIRIHRSDADKSDAVLRTCSQKLSETLELTRDTVHNLRADIKTGVEALESIIKGFHFCPVDFMHSGDISTISSTNMKILEANITEALTNASRHSHATEIQIKVDIGRRNIRLYYKDNGAGCADIRENLGLTGMRERVRDAGGTIAINGSDGFMIVCNLPERGIEEEGDT